MERLAFVIPVRKSDHPRVRSTSLLEAMLHYTILALCRQAYDGIDVIVVRHVSAARHQEHQVTFLDVDPLSVLSAGLAVRQDKGLRCLLGAAYAVYCRDASAVMFVDADDYVNVTLADRALTQLRHNRTTDGLLLVKGLHIAFRLEPPGQLHYGRAFLVRDFHLTCGTSRVFSATAIRSLVQQAAGRDLDSSGDWPEAGTSWIRATGPSHQWTADALKDDRRRMVIESIGGHVDNRRFRLEPLDLVGAAKTCGHCNHDGPNGGAIHFDKVIGAVPTDILYRDFGVEASASIHIS